MKAVSDYDLPRSGVITQAERERLASRGAAYSRWNEAEALPETERGEWVEWGGGPCPVPPGSLLEIRTTDGGTGIVDEATCSLFPCWWSDRDGARFITAYRIVEAPSDEAG